MDYNKWKEKTLEKIKAFESTEPFELKMLYDEREWKGFESRVLSWCKQFKNEVQEGKITNVSHAKLEGDNHNWYKKVR